MCRQEAIRQGCGNYPALLPNVVSTLEALDERDGGELSWGERYSRLCVLEKQGWGSVRMIRRLWGVENVEVGYKGIESLADAGVAEVEEREVGGEWVWGVRLHDLLHDVASELAKQGNGVGARHRLLLESYKVRMNVDGCREWWGPSVAEDHYIRENVSRHLVRGGEERS